MKTVMAIAILAFSCSSFAWNSTEPTTKEYVFKYKLGGTSIDIKSKGASYEDAFASAADTCFKFYKGAGKISDDRGLDIIDVCANPRS
jgi:hypothetical protein